MARQQATALLGQQTLQRIFEGKSGRKQKQASVKTGHAFSSSTLLEERLFR
jgi:hypothetical protein